MSILHHLLDFLFPIRSLTGAEGSWITDEERASMRLFPVRLHRELLRKRGLKSLDCVIAAGSYSSSPLLKKAIHAFKYRRIQPLGGELADRIALSLPGLLMLPEGYRPPASHHFQFPSPKSQSLSPKSQSPILCPVPLHWIRRFHRGFNQAELLARALSRKTGWPVTSLLKRTRATGHQAHRSRLERFTAMEDVFRFDRTKGAPPPCVLLVDDVFTTGATLDACARELKKAGAKYVVGLVVAHG